MNTKSFGADHSTEDPRTYTHHVTTNAAPLITGGYQYSPTEIEDQYNVGKCTAISMVQNAEKALGRKFSYDFQYLLQKFYIDGNWDEGSSILSALKVGTKFGFLPAELWTHTTDADSDNDRGGNYASFVAKLQAIPVIEIQRLISLCTDKLVGYAQILDLSTSSLAQAILDSKSGILCRYNVGNEWYTLPDGVISWSSELDPIRPPHTIIDGHAINCNYFDFQNFPNTLVHANTWSKDWDLEGNCHIDNTNYSPTEAWIPYYNTIPPTTTTNFHFTNNLFFGESGESVAALNALLGVSGSLYWFQTVSAVNAYQKHFGLANGSKGFVVQQDMITKLNG